jgi:hypothetical protein
MKKNMCKELAYYILNNQKLDWLKRKELWRADKIDFYLFFSSLIIFTLVINFGEVFFLPMMTIFIITGFIGKVRNIKTVPGDIESKLIGLMICMGFIFSIFMIFISIFVVTT